MSSPGAQSTNQIRKKLPWLGNRNSNRGSRRSARGSKGSVVVRWLGREEFRFIGLDYKGLK
eukprot:1629055-Pyramimonas_sp.AAC.2